MNLIKSRKRVADHGEVFDAMRDHVKHESERIYSCFLEPACGSGNFIVKVLQRKVATVERKFGKSDFDITNLSNDEVFNSPEFANTMLDMPCRGVGGQP